MKPLAQAFCMQGSLLLNQVFGAHAVHETELVDAEYEFKGQLLQQDVSHEELLLKNPKSHIEHDDDTAFGKEPTGHAVHCEAAAADTWAAGHGLQCWEPGDDEKVPGGQGRQESTALSFLK